LIGCADFVVEIGVVVRSLLPRLSFILNGLETDEFVKSNGGGGCRRGDGMEVGFILSFHYLF
jgi:hypothetical protein